MFPHIKELNSRIRSSERFPRIRDAEAEISFKGDSNKKRKSNVKLKMMAESQSDFFTSYTINKDDSCSKYMPFDEIVYPKIFNDVQVPTESIEELWVSGFLDHARRNKTKQSKKDLKLLTEMPDSVVFPHVAEKRRAISRENKILENSLQRKSKKKVMTTEIQKERDPYKGLTVEDEYRLQDFAKRIQRAQKKSKKFVEYIDSNRRLANARKQQKVIKNIFEAEDLENVFEAERLEHEAAIVIQRMWRRPFPLMKLRYTCFCMIMAVRIQKMVRGMIARKWISEWLRFREKYVRLWQCRIRRWLSNSRWQKQLNIEIQASITIQRIIRGKLGRLRWYNRKCYINAIKIQRLWRGVVARNKADKRWLDQVVVPIQCIARKMLGKKKLGQYRHELNAAAIHIQSCFRAWISTNILNKRLYDRETSYRSDMTAILTAEEEFGEDKLVKLADRFTKKEFKSKLESESKSLFELTNLIQIQENELMETKRQLAALSPRSIQQGWKKEIEESVHKMRAALTESKVAAIFKKGLSIKVLEERFQQRIEELEDYARLCRRVSHCRELDLDENTRRESHYLSKESRKKKRQAIGDEKRKWKIRFYNSDGKPDIHRRPGRAFDPSILAGPDRATYCAGHDVDLTAFMSKSDEIPGKKKAVDKTMAKVSLQSYLLQVNQFERILNPLFEIMQKGMVGGGAHPTPAEQGWGPEGDKLAEAMVDIGVSRPSPSIRKGIRNSKKKVRFTAESQLVRSTTTSSPVRPDPLRETTHETSDISQQQDSIRRKNNIQKASEDITLSNGSNSTRQETVMKKDFNETETRKPTPVKPLSEADAKRAQRRKERTRDRRRETTTIPWALLDELDGEKKRFELEQQYIEVNLKY